jgi:uncharacterized protein (TIGR03086 family)
VRQALSYAIPYDDIIAIGAQGYGTQSRGPVPAGVWPWSEETPQYTQDLEKAKQLLVEAGYPDGGFNLRLTYASENQNEERFAPLIKDAFAEIGVEVEIQAIQFSQQWEEAKADPATAQDIFLLLYWPTYSDAGSDNLWSMFHSSEAPFFNLSYWVNEEFDSTLDEAIALTVTDPAQSQQLYNDAMTLLVDEAPGLFFGMAGLEAPKVPPVEDDPAAAFAAMQEAVQGALDDPARATKEYEGFAGKSTFEKGVDQFICTDLIVHGWDLSRAAGLDERIDPQDIKAVRHAMAPMADQMRSPRAFGPEIEVPAGADEQTKLLAFLGRRV